MVWVLIVVLVVIALLVVWLIALYNGLVRKRNRVDNAWAQIDVQLKRRRDLIPNLVETVKGYAAHERGTFEAVTEARAAAAQRAQTPGADAAAEGILSQALGRLFAVAEAYPDLQANENFLELQAQLQDTENKIAVSRQVYNDTVLTYNNAIQVFPGRADRRAASISRSASSSRSRTRRDASADRQLQPRSHPAPRHAPAAPPRRCASDRRARTVLSCAAVARACTRGGAEAKSFSLPQAASPSRWR